MENRLSCRQVDELCRGERTMLNYLILGICILLTIGIIILFVQVIRTGWKLKMLDDLAYHIVKGDKIKVKRIETSDRS